MATATRNNSLIELLTTKKVIICCGSGGVGKTSLSAALALLAAMHGRQTLIMTIDPARRLASALGLSALTNRQSPVPEEELQKAGIALSGVFHAMMLDAKRTWDELVARYAPSDSVRDKIYNNEIYKNISGALSGSQEYMALEKLYEMATVYTYDLIIVDTPPSQNAIDFLKAPVKMSAFVGNSRFFQIFLSPGMRAGKLSWKMFSSGSASLLKILEKITGAEMIRDIAEFFSNFEDMIAGFGHRAQAIDDLIHSPACSFVLIAAPEGPSIKDALVFKQKLDELGLPFWGVILNRVMPRLPKTADLRLIAAPELSDQSHQASKLVDLLMKIYELQQRKVTVEERQIAELRNRLGQTLALKTIPLLPVEVNELTVVKRLTELIEQL